MYASFGCIPLALHLINFFDPGLHSSCLLPTLMAPTRSSQSKQILGQNYDGLESGLRLQRRISRSPFHLYFTDILGRLIFTKMTRRPASPTYTILPLLIHRGKQLPAVQPLHQNREKHLTSPSLEPSTSSTLPVMWPLNKCHV